MAAALKGGREERLNDLQRQLHGDEAGRQHQHVGIVVAAGQRGQLGRPAQRRTDALMLVEGHVDAVARAAHGDARIAAAALHCLSARMREIRIVARLLRKSSEILEGEPIAGQPFLYFSFELKTCMVAADGDFLVWVHDIHNSFSSMGHRPAKGHKYKDYVRRKVPVGEPGRVINRKNNKNFRKTACNSQKSRNFVLANASHRSTEPRRKREHNGPNPGSRHIGGCPGNRKKPRWRNGRRARFRCEC